MNEIVLEIELMEQLMGKGNGPKPTYFYVQGYGKDLKNDIEQLAKVTQSKKTVVFDRVVHNMQHSIVEDYKVIIEKNKSLGQEYEGMVLVDFTDLELDELPGFVEYLANTQNRINYIFTIQDTREKEYVKKLLEQNFFIREIESKPYSAEEQFAAIQEGLKQFEEGGIQVKLSSSVEESLLKQLEEKEWEKGDAVLFRLKNAISAVIYESLVSKQSNSLEIGESLVSEMFERLETKTEKKRRIGFAVGGFENE